MSLSVCLCQLMCERVCLLVCGVCVKTACINDGCLTACGDDRQTHDFFASRPQKNTKKRRAMSFNPPPPFRLTELSRRRFHHSFTIYLFIHLDFVEQNSVVNTQFFSFENVELWFIDVFSLSDYEYFASKNSHFFLELKTRPGTSFYLVIHGHCFSLLPSNTTILKGLFSCRCGPLIFGFVIARGLASNTNAHYTV